MNHAIITYDKHKTTSSALDVERETVHISDDQKLIAMIDNDGTTETIRYQIDNHLGSASLELDQDADIISYEEYHPFGTTSYRSGRSETEVSLKRYKYVGKERDEETGLYYYGARYYASWIARFVSVDPLQHDYPIYTPYQYAGNKPISYIDLDGLEEAKVESNYMDNLRAGSLSVQHVNSTSVSSGGEKVQIQHSQHNYRVWSLFEHKNSLHSDFAGMLSIKQSEIAFEGETVGRLTEATFYNVWSAENSTMSETYINSDQKAKLDEFMGSFEANIGTTIIASAELAMGIAGLIIETYSWVQTGTMDSPLVIPAMAFSLDQAIGGAHTFYDLAKAQYDPKYEYKIGKRQIVNLGGKNAGIIYDLTSIGINSYQIYDALTDPNTTINTVQKGFEIFDTGEDVGMFLNGIMKSDTTKMNWVIE